MKFVDFVTLQRGFDLPKTEIVQGDVPVVGSTSIIGYHNVAKVAAPGVCTGRSGSLGTVQFIDKPFWPHNTSLWVKDYKGNDPRFVYYCLQSLDFGRFNAGAGVPTLNRNHLDGLIVNVPDLPTQRKIAGILSAYDDLIENNLRRIKILEEMAQSLYREWFVHFRFPGHESVNFVDSPRDQIPEWWDVRTAGELIGFHVGGGWGKEAQDDTHSESAYVIRGTDIPAARLCDRSSVPFRYHTESNLRSRRLEVGDIVFEVSGGSKGQPVGRALFVSKNLLDSFEGADVMCASFCKLLRTDTKAIASELFYYHLKEIYEDGRIDQYQVQSTGITNFKFAPFLDQELIVVPPQNLQEKWVRSVVPLLQQINTLGQKCQNLRRTRDLLLPKLLNGNSES